MEGRIKGRMEGGTERRMDGRIKGRTEGRVKGRTERRGTWREWEYGGKEKTHFNMRKMKSLCIQK